MRYLPAIVAAALLVATLAAPAASAKRTPTIYVDARIDAPGRDKLFFTAARAGEEGFASFSVFRDLKDALALNGYMRMGRQRVSPRRVDAGFEGIGAVRARFRERSRERRTPGGCEGHLSVRKGVLVGRGSFRGEHGYLIARDHRLVATITVDRTRKCGGPYRPRIGEAAVTLGACGPQNTMTGGFAPEGGLFSGEVFAVKFEGGARAAIMREVHYWTGGFTPSDDLSTAIVDPGRPFAGSATYADRSLTGDLTVRFLGLERPTPLTPADARLRRSPDGSLSIHCGTSGVLAAWARRATRAGAWPAARSLAVLDLARGAGGQGRSGHR